MAQAAWYFDFISPFAYLQWPRIRALSMTMDIELRPILLAGVLARCGQKGPAEIPEKREFTYRFVQWRAGQLGLGLRFPPAHPFNSLAALRLAIAAGTTVEAVDAIFAHLWRDGLRGDDAASLAAVASQLGIDDCASAIAESAVKQRLLQNGALAEADRVFGVPTIVAAGQAFWGEDATDMFESFLADPSLFEGEEMRRLGALPIGAERRFG